MSGSLGQTTVFRVHEMSQVNSITILCDNIAWHQQEAKEWLKMKGVCSHIKSIYETLKEIAEHIVMKHLSAVIRPTFSCIQCSNVH